MITYIRKNIKGYYVEFPDEIDANYWKGKIGSTYKDFEDNKWIKLSDELVVFHTEYPHASISLVLAMEIPKTPIYIKTLEDVKLKKLLDINEYDNSQFVNGFDIIYNNDTITTWITPSERANYRNSIDAAELMGITEVSLYIEEIPLTIPTATAKLMLSLILLYADLCFIVTKQHKSDIEAMNSIEDVDSYDITIGYPEKLRFTID